jgi:SNF2 family DNA or RNA helicase
MPAAELVGNRIVLDTEYRDRDLIRAVPGARYDKDTREWHVPVSWANCLCLRGVFGDRLVLGDELRAWAEREVTTRVGPATANRDAALDPAEDCEGDERLYPYQRTGVRFLVSAESAVLADEMGTGKTVQTIMALEAQGAYPALVICPNSVKGTWAAEYARWAPDRKVVIVGGGAVTRRKQLDQDADVYVINWEALRIHSRLAPYGSVRLTDKEKTPGELNRVWGAVVADEAHRAKEPKSKQTRALWAIGKSALHRYALTGTPVANNPADFWALLHFVSPEEWPARTKYIDRYCLTAWNAFGGVDVVGIRAELREEFFKVVDPRFLRRSKEVVLPWLPPKVHLTRKVEMPAKQAKAYKELRDGMVAELDSGIMMALDSLSLLGRMSQMASSYAEVQPDGSIRLSEPSGKLDELDAILDELGDEPVVVFAASRQLIELAQARMVKRGVSYGLITGAVSPADREWAKEAFMAGRLQVLLLTLGAGAEGLTLTKARHLVFLQRSWSLVENLQAEDRIHRPGAEQHDSVFIHEIVATGTVEEDLLSALEAKGDMLEQVARDKELLRKVLGR